MKVKFFSIHTVYVFMLSLLLLGLGAGIYVYYIPASLSPRLIFCLLFGVDLLFLALLLIYILQQNRKTQQQLYQAAYIDPITQGPTWKKAQQEILKILQQNPQQKFAFVIFDINKFKLLNDRLGYLKANDILRHIAFILREDLQAQEMFCRVQADIFQILVKYQTEEQLKNRLEVLNEKIISTCPIEKTSFQIILSFGVYPLSKKPTSLNELLAKAALARDTVKGKYDHIIGFYNTFLQKRLQLEQEIENHMEDALKKEQFQLYLSTIRDMEGSFYGAEVSLRWNLPPYGEINESFFRHVFTQNGFIYRLDLYVAEKICQFQKQRIQEKKDLFPLFLNLSTDSLQSPQFAGALVRLIKKYQLDTSLLILQAAPHNEISQIDIIEKIAYRLHDEGFVLSLDQASQGYSPLELLKTLPLQIIKIEKETVADLEENQRARRLADSLIYMAQQMKVKIIFSGVSSFAQRQILKNLGADFIMGPVNGIDIALQESDHILKKQNE